MTEAAHFLFLSRKLRERAEEALVIAETFRDPEARRMMLEVAERDQKLADRLEHETAVAQRPMDVAGRAGW